MSNETTTDTKNRKIGRIVALVVAVLVVAALIIGGARKKADAPTTVGDALPEGCKPGFLFSETTGKPCPQPEGQMPAFSGATDGASLSYEAALSEYAGKTVGFDASCKQVLGVSDGIVPVGTRVLIANHSPKQLTLSVEGRSETLDGYHYFTSALKTKGAVKVLCESKEAATISVQ